VKSPEAALTGNDVSGSHKTGSDRVRIHNRFLRFFLSLVVVQMYHCAWPEVAWLPYAPWKCGVHASATGSCTISALVGPFHRKWRHQTSPDPFGAPLEGWCARMRNRKLCNIRSNVTNRASAGKYGSTHAQSQVPFGCFLGHLGHITLSFSTN
jgi:hypothetical protein